MVNPTSTREVLAEAADVIPGGYNSNQRGIILAQEGHEVVTARDGAEALDYFVRDRWDVVITDRSMPKMRGDELAAKIKLDMNPEQRLQEIREAIAAHNAEINDIPLHRQVIPWAERSNVTAPYRVDNHMIAYRVSLQ